MRGRVLIVDDDSSLRELLVAGLRRRDFHPVAVASAEEALSLLDAESFDTVVTDLKLRGMNGLELCERIAGSRSHLPVVVITGFGSLETAVGAIRVGAYDFVTKPIDTDALTLILDRAVRFRCLQEEVRRLQGRLAARSDYQDLIGESPPMHRVFDLIARLADSEASVLITGETGTGKELVARALHQTSRRREGAFVAVNCAGVPEALLESELFGHVKGAFTDARAPRRGLFVEADGGTLFLDEIGCMPLTLQPKLLRALQERRIRPVGADGESQVDVRIIAATNRDIESAASEGLFREDLFFRLNVVQIPLPPLRSRGNDVLLLAQRFLERFADKSVRRVQGLSAQAAEKLLAYSWPGNVRELQNCIERAVALTSFEMLTVEDLPDKIRNYSRSHVLIASDDPAELVSMEEVERRYILSVLEAVAGNKSEAAGILGFDRKTLYRKLERYRSLSGQSIDMEQLRPQFGGESGSHSADEDG